jgi:urease accessory protein
VKHTVIEQPAQLDLSFARRGEQTVFDRRLFSWPFVLTRTFFLDATPAHQLTAMVQTSSGAMHGGDRLVQRISVGRDAAVHIKTQGAAAVHRAPPGLVTHESVSLRVAEGGILQYLPEPRILFPDAALAQTIDLDCAPGGTAIVSDAFTVHDPVGAGRGFRGLESTMTLRQGGAEPAMIDRMQITGLTARELRRQIAFGTLAVVTPLPATALEPLALDLSAQLVSIPSLYSAASLLPGELGIGLRFVARDLRGLRAGLDLALGKIRSHLIGQTSACLSKR